METMEIIMTIMKVTMHLTQVNITLKITFRLLSLECENSLKIVAFLSRFLTLSDARDCSHATDNCVFFK